MKDITNILGEPEEAVEISRLYLNYYGFYK